ncbi:prominin-2-like isoform X2 [Narcine bancroftii]|uniref:prominin-2-like isoform X2 n=1 Tax=Narcine bancroftii TaxID=1343680 RepID=UPI0038314072
MSARPVNGEIRKGSLLQASTQGHFMGLHRGRMDLLIFLAGIFLIPHPGASQNCTAGPLQFENLPQHNFNRLSSEVGPIQPLYNMVNLYLDVVQPNDFPVEIIQNQIKNQNYVSQNYQEVLRYQAGYLVSFILGVLFFVLMPLVGLIFCCCRCCGKCGGQVKERTKSTDCQRCTLAMFLLMTTVIILAGVACAFTANQNVTNGMEPSVTAFRAILRDVITYTNNIPENLSRLTAQFSVLRNGIISELARVSGTLGFTIKDALGQVVYPSLMMVSARIQDVSTLKGHLQTIISVNGSLADTQRQLINKLSSLQADIITTAKDPNCQGCESAEQAVSRLDLSFTYGAPTEIQSVFNKLTSFSSAALNSSLEQANRSLDEIPGRVMNQSSQVFTDIKRVLDDVESNLSSAIQRVTFLDSLKNVEDAINSPQIIQVSDEVKRFNYYRWIVSIVLCCIILLIIACNVLGLGLGTAGIITRDDVNRGNTCSKSGANFLMAGVGFSFIFSWLLILLVFVTFFVGGNVRTLACKPWETGEIYQVVDDLAEQSNILNLSNIFRAPISFSTLHRHCEEGRSLWYLLPRNLIAELEKQLNVTTYFQDAVQSSKQLDVDLSNIVLLDSTARNNLLAFASSGIEAINDTNLISPAITNELLPLAELLKSLEQAQSDPVIKANLSRQSNELQEIDNTLMNNLRQDLVRLNTSYQNVASFAPTVQSLIIKTIQSIDVAQAAIITTTQTVLKNVSKCLTMKELGYFDQYIQWIRTMLMDNLLTCQPAVILIDNIRVLLCDNITDPWNAFWFCLGWCTLFLIPSIIFAVKTAKHYRSIKDAANSPELSEMMQFKFPRVESTYTSPPPRVSTAPAH